VRQQRGEKRGSGSSPGASSNGLARKSDKNADRQKKMGGLKTRLFIVYILLCDMIRADLAVNTKNSLNINQSNVMIYMGFISVT
jgi:hypothetical protein